MPAPFSIYRVLCSTPPDLESERLIFESSLAGFTEHTTFPQQVLFAGASFRPKFDADRYRAATEANVRQSDFFLHIFSGTWPGDTFRSFINLAQACADDPAMPMRQVAVLFKNFDEAGEPVRKFRDGLTGAAKCDVREFHDPAELDRLLGEIYVSWWESVRARP
jgi:hypothetical protein